MKDIGLIFIIDSQSFDIFVCKLGAPVPPSSTFGLGRRRKNAVRRVELSVKVEIGDIITLQMVNSASYRPPRSPRKSSMLYVSRYLTIRSMSKLISTLMYLYFALGFSSVGKKIQALGKAEDWLKLRYSVYVSCPYCR